MTHLVVTLPLKIESTANKREHWSQRAARARAHRDTARLCLMQSRICRIVDGTETCQGRPLPATVTLTRIAPRELDTDNLAISFKSVRDGIADWLGVNDNDKRIEWRYEQEKGAPRYYAARIQVQSKEQA